MKTISWSDLRVYVSNLESKTRVYEREAASMAKDLKREREARVAAERALEKEKAHRDSRFEAVKTERDEARRRAREGDRHLDEVQSEANEAQRLLTLARAEIESLKNELAAVGKRNEFLDQKKEIIDELESEIVDLETRVDRLRVDAEDREREIRDLKEQSQQGDDASKLLPAIRMIPGYEDYSGDDTLYVAAKIIRRVKDDRERENRLRSDLGDMRASLTAALHTLNEYGDISAFCTGQRNADALSKFVHKNFFKMED